MSTIEWTGKTWNPIAGCSIVSTECKNCYAMKMAHRLAAMGQAKYGGLTEVRNGQVVWNGKIWFDKDALEIPVKRKKPTTYFVNSMSDLFHESVQLEWLDLIYKRMQTARQHTYQILTKRPERMREYLSKDVLVPWGGFTFGVDTGRKIWHGTSVGYRLAKGRIEHLREAPSFIRFLSCEPLLEDLGKLDLTGIHWVIVGGESGPKAPTNESTMGSQHRSAVPRAEGKSFRQATRSRLIALQTRKGRGYERMARRPAHPRNASMTSLAQHVTEPLSRRVLKVRR
jgi:protein gp37